MTLEEELDRVAAECRFSGVVRVDRGGAPVLTRAYGLADRAHGVPNRMDSQFAIASGMKGLTALTVLSLVTTGELALATTARALLGADLPLVRDDVTVEHLLGHRSGIGDYLDEDSVGDVTDHVLTVPVHRLATPEDYLPVLDGHPTVFAPDERFAYNNGGYVVLALLAERSSRTPFADLVRERVLEPAGMTGTAFLRSDEPSARAAVGYLGADGPRNNVLHLPVVGGGDGGIYSTAADLRALWLAVFAGRVLPTDRVAEMVRPRSDVPGESMRYGLGFWLRATGDAVVLEGFDAGVSFRSVHDPSYHVTHTMLANTSEGQFPVSRLLDRLLLG